jgi:pseudouridine-5'-phosphate glycosidase
MGIVPMTRLPPFYHLSAELARARALDLPIVALESAVITHGLPHPENFNLAREVENEVRALGSTPATIAVLDGKICAGINEMQLDRLAREEALIKISAREFAQAITRGLSGGTTVAGTMMAAKTLGIRVFATGGIGGVHRQEPLNVWERYRQNYDISADLTQLGEIPMIVVCAGAKAILDLPATLEVLETLGVPVIGYGCDEFPAFYSRSSGLKASLRADSPEEVVRIARTHWTVGMQSAVLVAVPPPEDVALPPEQVEEAIREALREAAEKEIHGQAVTPFLLRRVSELSGGASLQANLALLRNNARVAASIARFLHPPTGRGTI